MTLRDELWTRVQNSLDRQGMMRHLGVRLLRVEPGLVELALPYSDRGDTTTRWGFTAAPWVHWLILRVVMQD
jgi:acyl-coenzyme A thioesterase PaaI-like protein